MAKLSRWRWLMRLAWKKSQKTQDNKKIRLKWDPMGLGKLNIITWFTSGIFWYQSTICFLINHMKKSLRERNIHMCSNQQCLECAGNHPNLVGMIDARVKMWSKRSDFLKRGLNKIKIIQNKGGLKRSRSYKILSQNLNRTKVSVKKGGEKDWVSFKNEVGSKPPGIPTWPTLIILVWEPI